MNLEINLTVDTERPKQLSALMTMLSALNTDSKVVNTEIATGPGPGAVVKELVTPPVETKTRKSKSVTVVTEPGAPSITPTSNLGPENTVIEGDYKIEDVRALLAVKVTSHRESIKNKLTELGAPNVTALKADNYSEFMAFLTDLK